MRRVSKPGGGCRHCGTARVRRRNHPLRLLLWPRHRPWCRLLLRHLTRPRPAPRRRKWRPPRRRLLRRRVPGLPCWCRLPRLPRHRGKTRRSRPWDRPRRPRHRRSPILGRPPRGILCREASPRPWTAQPTRSRRLGSAWDFKAARAWGTFAPQNATGDQMIERSSGACVQAPWSSIPNCARKAVAVSSQLGGWKPVAIRASRAATRSGFSIRPRITS